MSGTRTRSSAALVGLAALAATLAATPPALAKLPAVRTVMTIVGSSSGVNREPTTVRPQASGCPPQTTELDERVTVRWKAVFKPVVVPLAEGPYLLYAPPHYRGGATGGTYSFHDTYLRSAPERFEPLAPEEPESCPTLQSFTASAQLGQRPHPGPYWDNEGFAPAVEFGVGVLGGKGQGSIKASPEEIDAPELEWEGESSGLVPIDVPNALPLYEMPERRNGAAPYATGVVLNWKRLQPQLAKLRRHGTVRLHIVKHLDNSKRPAPFDEECFRGGAHPSCSESMDLNFTVTLRWLSPARGCDVASARSCLIRPWAVPDNRPAPPLP
ncbi:MAG: hypothetical protein ACTHO8_08350 [Solirubrobacterales bacterium]